MRIPTRISRTSLFFYVALICGCAASPDKKPLTPNRVEDKAQAETESTARSASSESLPEVKQIGTDVLKPSPDTVSPEDWYEAGAASPLVLHVQTKGGARLSEGDPIKITVETDRQSQIHCYYQDGEGTVSRLFPNRFSTDSILNAGETLVLPKSDEWQLSATLAGETENFLCIAIPPEWFDQLSVIPLLPDLQPIATTNLSQIYIRYKNVIGAQLINQTTSVAVN